MIDIESKVVDEISQALNGVLVLSKYVPIPSEFPCVMIRLYNDSTLTSTRDNQLKEHHAIVEIQIDVFSNKATGGKKEVKEIFQTVDEKMQEMKFTRASFGYVENVEDYTITRCVGTYNAIVEEAKTIDGNTVHQMYR